MQVCDPYYSMADHDNKTLKEKDVDTEAGWKLMKFEFSTGRAVESW